MLILDDKRFIETPFSSEQEIEIVVLSRYEYLFGAGSFLIPKIKIRTEGGSGTIPDGFAIDIADRKWYLVEVELSSHGVWEHIAPQVSKQLVAAQQDSTKRLLVEVAVNQYRDDPRLRDKFSEEGIAELDVRHILSSIIERDPILGIPIDNVSTDLRQWAASLRVEVKLWTIKKYTNYKNPSEVIFQFPDEFRPTFDTAIPDDSGSKNAGDRPMAIYDVTLADLLARGLLSPNQTLLFNYAPRGMSRREFKAIIQADGSLLVDGVLHTSPSYAAIACIQAAGSERETENGWLKWRTEDGKLLNQLREEFIKR